jgi:hypothetical protein
MACVRRFGESSRKSGLALDGVWSRNGADSLTGPVSTFGLIACDW